MRKSLISVVVVVAGLFASAPAHASHACQGPVDQNCTWTFQDGQQEQCTYFVGVSVTEPVIGGPYYSYLCDGPAESQMAGLR
ncbi:MAG: hypothetical protein ACYDCC_01590 [Actinomycetota bacterium]